MRLTSPWPDDAANSTLPSVSPMPTASTIARSRPRTRRLGFCAATAAAITSSAVERKTTDAHQKSALPATCIGGK